MTDPFVPPTIAQGVTPPTNAQLVTLLRNGAEAFSSLSDISLIIGRVDQVAPSREQVAKFRAAADALEAAVSLPDTEEQERHDITIHAEGEQHALDGVYVMFGVEHYHELDAIAQRLKAPSSAPQEPVAWLMQHGETGLRQFCWTRDEVEEIQNDAPGRWLEVGPLYLAAPPAPPQTPRDAMLEEEVKRIRFVCEEERSDHDVLDDVAGELEELWGKIIEARKLSVPAPSPRAWRTDAIRKLRDERKCFFEQDATMAFEAGTTVFIFPPNLLDDLLATVASSVAASLPSSPTAPRPEVVCLCGSTRFMDAFFEEGWRLTLEGKIVLSVGVVKTAEHHAGEALGQEVADRLDELHLRKIDLADRVLVLNVGGYIGSSTRKEIAYAESQGKPIQYLNDPSLPASAEQPT